MNTPTNPWQDVLTSLHTNVDILRKEALAAAQRANIAEALLKKIFWGDGVGYEMPDDLLKEIEETLGGKL